MADLVISTTDLGLGAVDAYVTIETVDVDGNRVTATTSDSVLVETISVQTDAETGAVTVPLAPTADLSPANVFYRATIRGYTRIFSKASGSENLVDTVQPVPDDALGSSLTVAGLADGDQVALRDQVPTLAGEFLPRYSAAVAAGDVDVVLCGDSVSVIAPNGGTGWSDRYVDRMADILGSADQSASSPDSGAAFRMLNISTNNTSAQDHIDDDSLADACTAQDPHLVILSSGLATWVADDITGESYISGLSNAIDLVRDTCTADLFVIHEFEPPVTDQPWGATTLPLVRALCAEKGVGLISLYEPFGSLSGDGDPDDLFLGDNLHPNDDGHALIWQIVAPLLTRSTPAPPGGGGGAVDSVNGQTGTVVLDAGDVGAATEGYVDTAVAGVDAADVGAVALAGFSTIATGGGGYIRFTQLDAPFGAISCIEIGGVGDPYPTYRLTGAGWQTIDSTTGATLNTMAASTSGVVDFGAAQVRTSLTPVGASDLTRKAYVDGRTGAASDTATGVVELATTGEATAGTDTQRAVTAAGSAAAIGAHAALASSVHGITAAAATVLDDTTVAAMRTTLGAASRTGGGASIVNPMGNQTGTVNLDLSLYSDWSMTATGNITLTVSNVPATGNGVWIGVRFTQDTTPRTLTLPSGSTKVGTLGTGSGAVTQLVAVTYDGGTTWRWSLQTGFA